ncbi:hypothetical protein A2U01_0110596, partial [Trifolium medium]|nr:hypothetical protein [Trifolium medium]
MSYLETVGLKSSEEVKLSGLGKSVTGGAGLRGGGMM